MVFLVETLCLYFSVDQSTFTFSSFIQEFHWRAMILAIEKKKKTEHANDTYPLPLNIEKQTEEIHFFEGTPVLTGSRSLLVRAHSWLLERILLLVHILLPPKNPTSIQGKNVDYLHLHLLSAGCSV